MADDIALRPAEPGDAEAIAVLWYEGWVDGHLGHTPDELIAHRSLDDFRRRVPPRIPVTTVAVVGGRIAGFVVVREDELEQVYVARDARGSGVAEAVIAHGESAVGRRFPTAWLAVATGNARARRFYDKQGWRDTGSFDYDAEIEGATFAVPCRRYEKDVSDQSA